MTRVLAAIFVLYVIALHMSIAAMEILSWLLALAGLVYRLRDAEMRRETLAFLGRYRRVLALLGALVAWVALSLVMTPLEKGFLIQWGFMRWALLLPLLTLAIDTFWSDGVERNLARAWAGMFLLLAIYAVVQMLFGLDLVRPDKHVVNPQAGGIFKAVGFFSMSLSFAYVFGQSAFGIARIIIQHSNLRLAVITVLLCIGGLAASMSRGAWLAALVTVGLYVLLVWRKWLLPFVAVVAIALFGASQLNDAIGAKITGMATGKMDNSSSMRVDLWKAYSQMFLDHPIFGIGVFEGDKLLPEYYSRLGIEQEFKSHAHNNYVQWLAGTGVPGFALFLILSFSFLRYAWQLRDETPWAWGLLLAHIFWQFGGLTECNFFDGEVNHFIVFGWALTWALHARVFSHSARDQASA